jgi:hypothetical protein
MPLFLLITGIVLQILDRLADKSKILVIKEILSYFANYYQPFLRRRHFFGILFLVGILSVVFNYLIVKKIDFYNNFLILLLLFTVPYFLILLVAIFDYFFLKKIDIRLNFLMLERELIQQFSLALFHPIIILAHVLRAFLLIFVYPPNGILFFNSLSGLIGFIFMIAGAIIYFI